MASPIDLTDIPPVTVDQLWRAVDVIADIYFDHAAHPIPSAKVDVALCTFWSSHRGTGAQGLAIEHRFVALLQGLSRRRFASLVQDRPWQVLHAAVVASATLRLNRAHGFNLMTFSAALYSGTRMDEALPIAPTMPPHRASMIAYRHPAGRDANPAQTSPA